MSKDYYKILGVDRNASAEEIKKAFRKKAHEYHPDKKGGDEAKFKEVNEAYQVLGNPQKKQQYDRFGSAFEQAQGRGGFHGFEGFRDYSSYANGFDMDDLGDIFGGLGDIFGFSSGRQGERTKRGADMQFSMAVDFMEAVFGAEKEISVKKMIACDRCSGQGAEPGAKIETCKVCGGTGRQTRVKRTILGNVQMQTACESCGGEGKTFSELCKKCSGQGAVEEDVKLKVRIPAGIDDGESLRLSGQGQAGLKGAPSGDLYLRIRVMPHSKFERDGYDIKSQREISISQAALGDKLEIETVDGPVKLKIPAGTQSGTVFKLRGKGVPKLRGRGRGDHLVRIKVVIPTGLSKKQRELLEEFDKS